MANVGDRVYGPAYHGVVSKVNTPEKRMWVRLPNGSTVYVDERTLEVLPDPTAKAKKKTTKKEGSK